MFSKPHLNLKYLKWFYKRVLNRINKLIYHRLITKQEKNPTNIPIIITSFNQLYYLQNIVSKLLRLGCKNIVILDNCSTYEPLLAYLKNLKSVTVVYNTSNAGHLAVWKHDTLLKTYGNGYYIVTDPDVVPLDNCPDDFIQQCLRVLKKNKGFTKVGLSLDLQNIPDSYIFKARVLEWESKFWINENPHGYLAPIDTTFALYRPGYQYYAGNFMTALRLKKPYTAIHGGWFIDFNNLTEEQSFYIETCNSSSSWLERDDVGHSKHY